MGIEDEISDNEEDHIGNDTEVEENVTEIPYTEANFQHEEENVVHVLRENSDSNENLSENTDHQFWKVQEPECLTRRQKG